MSCYVYGNEIEYEFKLMEDSDRAKLKKFACGNDKLDKFIQCEILPGISVVNEDGLIFKAENIQTAEIIAVVSLACSGIVFVQTNYMKLLPAIKIDVFAVDTTYQKLHYSEESKTSPNPDDHFYLSDCIMSDVIMHCSEISETQALVDYILLYADKNALRFYERNQFTNFEDYMQKESNMEINENIPMYMKL